jgi:hypothetical protein
MLSRKINPESQFNKAVLSEEFLNILKREKKALNLKYKKQLFSKEIERLSSKK